MQDARIDLHDVADDRRVAAADVAVKDADGAVVGVIAINIEDGETVYVKAKATVLATGGAGRIYSSTTNAHINTLFDKSVGDAVVMSFNNDMIVNA